MSRGLPNSRVYTHAKCGQQTSVTDEHFIMMSNPLGDISYTRCAHCDKDCKIEEFAWSDTQEPLPDFYARHSQNVAGWIKVFGSSTTWMGIGFLLGIIVAVVAVYYLGICLGGLAGGFLTVLFVFLAILFAAYVASPLAYKFAFGNVDCRTFR